jgi:hypothetical protein
MVVRGIAPKKKTMNRKLRLGKGIAMEPKVHIIEKYFQVVLGSVTMTNVKCKGGKEIDLLAMDPKTLEKYHVESRVSTSFKLRREARAELRVSYESLALPAFQLLFNF